jgi:hypothetical protein
MLQNSKVHKILGHHFPLNKKVSFPLNGDFCDVFIHKAHGEITSVVIVPQLLHITNQQNPDVTIVASSKLVHADILR